MADVEASPQVAMPPDVTPEALQGIVQTHAALPAPPVDLANPSPQLVTAIYAALASLSSKYEAEVAAREAREADVESQLNEANARQNDAEQRAATASSEAQSAQQEKATTQSALAEVQAELAAIKSDLESGNSASLEVKAVLEKEQREKREILEVLDRERAEVSRSAQELDSLKATVKELRKENSQLSAEVQEIKATESTARFKVQSLTQELELAQKDAAWAHAELSKVNTEQTAFRSSKHAEIVRLQSELDSATASLTALESKSEMLQAAVEQNTRRLNEAASEKEELNARVASQEESFRREMETKDRLTSLLERRADDAARRVQQVEEAWEKVLEECREREEELRAEMQGGRADVERLEQEKQDLKTALDRLAESVGIDTGSAPRASTPSTPLVRGVGSVGLGMSPTASMAASMQRSGKTFTEVYTSLAKTEEELRREKLETNRLTQILETVMTDLQERAPALQAQREETERLGAALEELSADFAKACEDRDVADRAQKQAVAQRTALERENGLMGQQLADLGRQVRTLTREIILRDDPAAADRLQDDGTEFPLNGSGEASDTNSVITTQLVTFDSLTSLVAQNGRLLRVARELGARMEEEEAKWRERNGREESEAVQEAVRTIERLESEIHSERARIEAVRRERDMFRSMLATGARGPAATATVTSSSSNGVDSGVHAALASQYSTLQTQFDAFREETARDADALKEEARHARDEAGRSALSAAREKAGREATEERLRTLQQTFELQRSELNEVTKRLRPQQEQIARLETSSQTLSEELLASRKELDRLRNESANLRAERDLAKAAEQRLVDEISSMVKEKAGLNELLRNVQTMQNELDRSAGESKRRLEGQVEKLEEQAREARERLQREEKARREADLRREVESNSLQSRIEKATAELAEVRQQLAVARTNVEHITRRSEDLQKQVDTKEEKLAVYERRAVGGSGSTTSATSSTSADASQQLQIELAELRGELRSAQVEAEQSRSHVEQFKAIAQASEEALTQLQATYDEYKTTTEATVAQKDSEIAHLRERLESVATEITTLQNEASTARQALEAQRNEFAAEKRSLEDALADLGSVEERARAEQQGVRDDVEQHARLAREAHAKYEAELVAHADDIRALSTIKEELERTRTEAREAQRNAEVAQANVNSSQVSWEAQKEALVKERDAVQQRLGEVTEQNKILHEHLEKLTEQVAQIRGARSGDSAVGGGGEASTSSTIAAAVDGDASFSASPPDELHQVVRYLRREKEIADLQLDLNKQEATRLRLNLDHANRALEEAKLQLAEERQAGANATASTSGAGARQHEDLMEKINQLSILRESNSTLRDEAERAHRKASTLQTELDASRSSIEPLREELRTARGELSAAQGQLAIVQEDNKRWQARAQSILAQYDRVDPDEVKRHEERAKELQVQLEAKEKQVVSSKEMFDKLRAQASNTIGRLKGEVQQVKEQLEGVTKERDEARAQQSGAGEEHGRVLQQKEVEYQVALADKQQRIDALERQVAELESAAAAANNNNNIAAADSTSNNVDADAAATATATALAEAQKVWEEEKAALQASKATLETREKHHHQKGREFLQQMRQAQKERDEVMKERDELKAKLEKAGGGEGVKEEGEASGADASAATSTGAPSADLAALQRESETLKARITELEAALQQANARVAELEAAAANNTSATGEAPTAPANESETITALKQAHAEELKQQQATLAKRQSMAIDVAVKKAQAAAGGNAAEVESLKQQHATALAAKEQELAQVKEERDALKASAASGSGGGAEEGEAGTSSPSGASAEALKARYEAGYSAGKNEATLRNQLLIKQKDSKIAKLNAEIAELKGGQGSAAAEGGATGSPGTSAASTPTATAAPSGPAAGAGAGPSVRGARGGGLPNRPGGAGGPGRGGAAAAATGRGGSLSVRGTGAIRGARGAARGGAAGQKRKASEGGAPTGPAAGGAAAAGGSGTGGGDGDGGNAAKKAKGA